MDINSLLTQKRFWGKILGTFFGFMIAGPLGAMFGLFIGNYFDRGLNEHLNHPFANILDLKHTHVFETFNNTCFSCLGYLAKADGVVTKSAIDLTNIFMQQMQLSNSQIKQAQEQFSLGKSKQFNPVAQLLLLKSQLINNPQILNLFINIMYEFCNTLGFTNNRILRLNEVLQTLGFSPVQKQQKYYEYDHYSQFNQKYQRYNNEQQPQRNNQSLHIDEAYIILNVSPQADKETVKKAYRKLISKNHPDRLIAQKRSAAEIKIANEKTQKIRQAYETICAAKNWD